MKNRFKGKKRQWLVVYGLLLSISITSVGFVQAASLSNDETSWLTYMREEEKLARDVYITLYEKWGKSIFTNIAVSEQRHMDAIKNLLMKYGVPDPVTDDTVGVFTDKFKNLYETLISKGSESLVQALKVGVFIEETDIHDLEQAITSTTHRDINKVYTNLMNGSYNHLAAFCSQLENRGVDCESDKLITEELYTQFSGPGSAPNSGDGIPDGSGWELPPKGAK